MPYNTRRKSLSLPSLGIALPGAPRPARSPPSSTDSLGASPPTKKVKRNHSVSTASTSSTSRFNETPASAARSTAHTPPPSPGGLAAQTKVDTEGINDTIVVAVIEQLEKTGNRPHLLKELAQVLQSTIPIVESSANPAAIISSRLATYLKRNWTALARCPLDKKLVGTHPKRVYYFLTTCPHQPIPDDASSSLAAARIISPSLSEEDEDLEVRSRDRSPSPELDLSSPEYEDDLDPFANPAHAPISNMSHSRRAQSPPLEHEEREFTQTATFLQQRRRSFEAESSREPSAPSEHIHRGDIIMGNTHDPLDETEESAAHKNSATAAALFGQMGHITGFPHEFTPSSPILRPSHVMDAPPMFKFGEVKATHDDLDWSLSIERPEEVALHELDELLGDY
ncbi:hypothetical protein M011DRAFT_401288 [Sporormia fimetaria CBS 119925]|uniref:GDS1 winged helix domain-containing protein n=1 Tax=Sporormia fimetaria CBS 119925 TaxID=1340428 RepID=A0A6A6VCU1_9PLEO|nr:hypothetical protein M011DRAFT_401288 [Sporormia fimetaria CBS 119925]